MPDSHQLDVAAPPMSRPPQGSPDVMREIDALVPGIAFVRQVTRDEIPTAWVPRDRVRDVLAQIKRTLGYRMLYDLTAIDERIRADRGDRPARDFTVVYHLLSYDRNADVRVKVALDEHDASLPTSTDLWPAANWYEREVWDMFGIAFAGHPHLTRILLPPTWTGHPLRKDYPARATEMGPFQMPESRVEEEAAALRFEPERWGLASSHGSDDFMFLNLGPQHPGTHGVL